jgi:hypothetical protein
MTGTSGRASSVLLINQAPPERPLEHISSTAYTLLSCCGRILALFFLQPLLLAHSSPTSPTPHGPGFEVALQQKKKDENSDGVNGERTLNNLPPIEEPTAGHPVSLLYGGPRTRDRCRRRGPLVKMCVTQVSQVHPTNLEPARIWRDVPLI